MYRTKYVCNHTYEAEGKALIVATECDDVDGEYVETLQDAFNSACNEETIEYEISRVYIDGYEVETSFEDYCNQIIGKLTEENGNNEINISLSINNWFKQFTEKYYKDAEFNEDEAYWIIKKTQDALTIES